MVQTVTGLPGGGRRAMRLLAPALASWALVPALLIDMRVGGVALAQYLFWSNLSAVLAVGIALAWRGRGHHLRRCPPRDLAVHAVDGVLSAAAGLLLMSAAYQASGAFVAALAAVHFMWPTHASLLLLWRSGPLPRARTAAAVACLGAGLALAALTTGAPGAVGAVALSAAILGGVAARQQAPPREPYSRVVVTSAIGTMAGAAWLLAGGAQWLPPTWQGVGAVAAQGALAQGLACVWWMRAMREAPSHRLMPWMALPPAVGLGLLAVGGHPVPVPVWAVLGCTVAAGAIAGTAQILLPVPAPTVAPPARRRARPAIPRSRLAGVRTRLPLPLEDSRPTIH